MKLTSAIFLAHATLCVTPNMETQFKTVVISLVAWAFTFIGVLAFLHAIEEIVGKVSPAPAQQEMKGGE